MGQVPLRQIDGGVLDDFYVSLMSPERGLSAASVKRCHSAIAAATKQAIEWKLIKARTRHWPPRLQPSAPRPRKYRPSNRSRPSFARPRRTTLIWRPSSPWRPSPGPDAANYAGSGGATWTRARNPDHRAAYAVVGGEHIIKPTKTHGVRCIALGDFGTDALRLHRERLEDRAKDAGVEITDETPIFTYDLENPISPDTASHYVRDIAARPRWTPISMPFATSRPAR